MPAALRPLLIVVVLALALAPLGLPPFAMTLLTEALILGLFAMSLDLMFGYTRLVSFGHAAYGWPMPAAAAVLQACRSVRGVLPRCGPASSRSASDDVHLATGAPSR